MPALFLRGTMPYFVCSLPNPGTKGPHRQFISEDPAEIIKWAQAEDRPGLSIYYCVNPLLPDATRRSLETVAEITCLHVDLDFKDVVEDPDTIDQRLRQLPLPPTEVRDSGGGRHVIWNLREPIRRDDPDFEPTKALLKRLTQCLCGDPAPAHIAALLRQPGTHNTKRGEPILCQTLWNGGGAVDPGDIKAMLDLVQDAPLLIRKSNGGSYTGNGHNGGWKAPVDVEARLAQMKWQGAGDTAINVTQRDCSAKMLREDCSVDVVVDYILEATQKAVAGELAANDWDWNEEKVQIEGMCYRHINKNHELSHLLPDYLRGRFEEIARRGGDPAIIRPFGRMWTVRANRCGPGEHNGNGDTGTEAPKAKDAKRSRFADIQWFKPVDEATFPPRRYLYGKHYQRRTVSGTIAPGGVGKSTQGIVDALAMATGRNLTGEQPEERCRVWIHNGEEGLEEMTRRILAVCKHYGIPQTELDGWLIITSGNQIPLRIAKGYSELKIDAALVEEIIQFITDKEIDVAIFDPLVMLHGTDESNPGRMDAVIRIFTRITDVCDCAIELAHHTRKLPYGAFELSIDDARGAGSVKDALRMVRLLNVMSKEEANNLGINEFERLSYFRIDRGKANYLPPAKSAVWRKFESVELDNGDNIGVITAWEHPGQGGPQTEAQKAQAYSDEQVFMRLLDRFAHEGRYVSDKPSPSYAPKVFAEEEEAKTAKVSKHRLKDAMRRLFATKQIRLEEYDRGSSRGAGTRLARASQGGL
jgi:RecA-family ATPase